jgi:hypothetical protein
MMRKASGWTFNVLYDFCLGTTVPTEGASVWGDSGCLGQLVRNHRWRGEYGNGIVFELTSGSGGWDEAILHSFNYADRDLPYASPIFDKTGGLYGTTFSGAAFGGGSVFS